MQEIHLLAMLRHQAIICYNEAFIYHGHLCVVMDYADGGDLSQRIKAEKKEKGGTGAFTVDQVLAVM